jgi:tetratricopeptide (TPR) repeat protein
MKPSSTREASQLEKLSKEGRRAYEKGDYNGAARAFEAVVKGYVALENELQAAEMANNCSVAYLQAGDAASALRIVEGSPETFSDAGDIRRQAIALGNRAAALDALGRKEEALNAYQQSAQLLEQTGEDELRAHLMQSLSALQLRSGRQMEALVSMQDGLNGLKKPTFKQRFLKKLIQAPFRFLK